MTSAPGRDRVAGRLLDDHDLSARSRAYAASVIQGDAWPLSAVDLSLLGWRTSTRAKRRNGYCTYDPDGRCTLAISEHVYEHGGFEACRETIRHELVHVWQHQHSGERAVPADAGLEVASSNASGRTVAIETGHGPSFRAWVGPLELSGRCSSPYEKTPEHYTYLLECPDCGGWWGKHRLCRRVRQAAHGPVGPEGYCYCTDCRTLLHLRSGDRYLDHGSHDDDAIRAFVDGGLGSLRTTRTDVLGGASPPTAE